MRLTVSVRDPEVEGVSATVAVETEPSAQTGRFAAELARAVGYAGAAAGEPPLYIGATPVLGAERTLSSPANVQVFSSTQFVPGCRFGPNSLSKTRS